MKTLVWIACCLSLVACQQNKNTDSDSTITVDYEDTVVNELSIEGNWEMTGYYNYKDDKVVDSFATDAGHRQIKMYSKDKVMWCKLVPADSSEWFAYGTFKTTDSTLVETMDFGSQTMNNIIAENNEFKFRLVLDNNKFSQIAVDESGHFVYSENYKRIK
ncbi:hypothetical protein Q2T40_08040 [Winogradskyella maritima]|uniref:Lipocalin-like domain-containing protein n=1 Tax=Winogradskyella maritima TaxID=1517766 RepID=A0ABV8AN63_9FLAO|nr:hypothetical protein [Winogradskyella maritima]